MDFHKFMECTDETERNIMVHIADEVLMRQGELREDQAVRTINALARQMK